MAAEEIEHAIEDYLDDCRARGLSGRTIRDNYGYALKIMWLPWCESRGLERLDDITSAEINRYSIHLQEHGGRRGRPLTASSVKTFVEAVNWWLRWCHAEGRAEKLSKGQTPKLPRKLLEVLTPQEIEAMVNVARNDRDRMLVRTLAETGIRVEELCTLTPQSLVRRGREYYLQVWGKGAKERMVPATRSLFDALERTARSRPKDVECAELFITSRRITGKGFMPLTRRVVERQIASLAEDAGIERRVWPHLLRHTYATRWLNDGGDPISLARILGHSSLAMIDRTYANMTPTDLWSIAERVRGRQAR